MKNLFTGLCILAVSSSVLMLGCKDSASSITPATTPTSGTRPSAPGESVSTSGVIFSSWITPTSWGARTNSGNYITYRSAITGIARLDQAMLDQGAILVYARFGGVNGEVVQIPFSRIWSRTETGLAYEKWGYQATLNQILVTVDPEINGYTPPADTQLRYVLITGETSANRRAAVDYNNYNEVKAAFNLTD